MFKNIFLWDCSIIIGEDSTRIVHNLGDKTESIAITLVHIAPDQF